MTYRAGGRASSEPRGGLFLRAALLGLIWGACSATAAAQAPVVWTGEVAGSSRTAWVYPGRDAAARPSPLVLAFHGLGGSSESMAALSRLHEVWPEATVVYPQGLPLVLGYPGWQLAPGEQGDRDVRFVEELLRDLAARYRVDARRIYAAGMSNGGIFTYVLLHALPDRFAAFAAVAASAFVREARVPRPFLIIHGSDDRVVPPQWAVESRDWLLGLNGCAGAPREWAPDTLVYESCSSGSPVAWWLHPGGHLWPAGASELVRRFFRENPRPEPRLRGDVNGDGLVSVGDVLALLQVVVGKAPLTPELLAAGDLDGDGSLTIADALRLLRAAIGLEVLGAEVADGPLGPA